MMFKLNVTMLLCVTLSVVTAQAQIVVYVDADAIGANDGSSWFDAHNDLQAALVAAVAGEEIWVANGTYTPTAGLDRGVSFSLVSGVGLFGGFEGGDSINFPGGETQRDQRNTDPDTNGAVLSGDIGSPGDNSDNSFHVVTGSGTDATSVLDGFTIKAGNANGGYLAREKPAAQNCTNLHVNHKASSAPTPLTACEDRFSSRYWKQRRARIFQILEANELFVSPPRPIRGDP